MVIMMIDGNQVRVRNVECRICKTEQHSFMRCEDCGKSQCVKTCTKSHYMPRGAFYFCIKCYPEFLKRRGKLLREVDGKAAAEYAAKHGTGDMSTVERNMKGDE